MKEMYKLLWEDTFNYQGLPNPDLWTLETGGHGFGNNEAQYYTDRIENAMVKDGVLHIIARKEDYLNRHYTSAKVTTKHKNHIKYGSIRIMAKMPKGNGTWPALWFLGENMDQVGWPMCGEIDLLEHVGHNPNQIHFSLHSKKRNFGIGTQLTHVIKVERATELFHEYRMDWDEKSISFYVDGTHHVTFTKNKKETVETWPFDAPFYLILNVALGGIWGGIIDDTIFPTEMHIKYVKVYERSDAV
ncbi:MAG: glycoside hydrolase [Tenericutes bacterium HGW-Tenericutes-6]|nr:MAG: glycoside hydrolase [Tenericutes bacterium HGW-Tenericutes-7]PKK93033.1 MAG: glycoside hydrolase [Tenericutes bacterium HGW-Tenericutes-6]